MATTWVFHRGSLGDSVLLWPMLRGLRGSGEIVTLVTDGARARLAARELGITGVDAEQRRFTSLWVAGAPVEPAGSVARVIACGIDAHDGAGRVWLANVARMFPDAWIETIAGRIDRPMALSLADLHGGLVTPSRRERPQGPIVVHVGAGSETKRWPMARWRELGGLLEGVVAIAGEVELERFTREERCLFESMGGRFLTDLLELADVIKTARVFVGCDSGPTHLAAALGAPTVALFGPTDPDEWGPVGPDVRVMRAQDAGVASLDPRQVAAACRDARA